MEDIDVIKQDPQGKETLRYSGIVLVRQTRRLLLQALFNRDELLLDQIVLHRGDRFVELYFSDRWYNIFEIHDLSDDRIKCWYCNVSYPAEIEKRAVCYRDLALDLLVYPDGRQLVLDENEFAELNIDEPIRKSARAALVEMQRLFESVVDGLYLEDPQALL
jgi:predicted RNA-binding protein associated with RNAse of E/G family